MQFNSNPKTIKASIFYTSKQCERVSDKSTNYWANWFVSLYQYICWNS